MGGYRGLPTVSGDTERHATQARARAENARRDSGLIP